MNKPAKVREVYKELRLSLAETLNVQETLEIASALVEIVSRDPKEPRFDLRTGGVPFDERPLDVVFSDGGWQILGRAYRDELDLDYNDEHELWLHNRMARWITEVVA